MYKGKPYINKHVRKWDQERNMEQHLSNLYNIRPRTGTIDHEEVVINNKKREMIKEDRFTEIQRQNRILLQKISHIMSKPTIQRNKTSVKQTKPSLNSSLRKRQLQNIQIENAKLLRRLQEKKSDYETEKFRISWKKQKNVIKNLSNFPLVISDRKKKRSSFSAIGQAALRNMHSTSYHEKPQARKNIEQCKIRTIDGLSFLITVRFTQDSLQIIGDSRDKKDIKVIEIDKKQAVQFIEQECGGKLDNIFDCLRFDKVDQVLYLVGKNLTLEEVKADEGSPRKFEDNPQYDISAHKNSEQNEEDGLVDNQNENMHEKKLNNWVPVEKKQTESLNNEENEESAQNEEKQDNQAKEQEHETEKKQESAQVEESKLIEADNQNKNESAQQEKKDEQKQAPIEEPVQNQKVESQKQEKQAEEQLKKQDEVVVNNNEEKEEEAVGQNRSQNIEQEGEQILESGADEFKEEILDEA